MKFFDQVTITIQSGKGGDGSVAGRREAKIPRGGPAGGDGGKGGSIIFRACKDEWTLMPYRYKKLFTAKPGNPGMSKDKYGSDAEDIELLVPIGTLLKDAITGKVLAHLYEDDQTRVGAKGGKGGIGNIHFKNSHNQFPTMALYGEPGKKKELLLELQLLADVALIGTPSVGKSTLINAVSGVKAKTAEYHFTTLVPNIGVVEHKGSSFTMIDVPGLIEGAGSGKGLGNEFLRHILKARVFLIFIDATKDIPGMSEPGLLLDEIMTYVEQRLVGSHERGQAIDSIHQELLLENDKLRYRVSTTIDKKPIILLQKALFFVVNKIDTLPDAEIRGEFSQLLQSHIETYVKKYIPSPTLDLSKHSIFISALTREGVDQLLDTLISMLQDTNFRTIGDQEIVAPESELMTPSVTNVSAEEIATLLEHGYIQEKQATKVQVRNVIHPEISFLTSVLPRGNEEAQMRYRETLGNEGHLKRLTKAGAKKGDILKIVSVYPGQETKYILRD